MGLTLHFLRHGQTTASRDNDFCGSTEADLTDEGRAMAEAFATAYASTPWRAVYCSPMRRARDSARPLCGRLGIEPVVRDGLREIDYGRWEGRTVEEISREYHDDHLRWSADPAWFAPTGGETAVTIATRVLNVIKEIQQAHSDGDVLIVSHKATIRIALCELLGIDVGRYRYRMVCPVASSTRVEFTRNGPLLLALADRTHLDERLRNLQGT